MLDKPDAGNVGCR